MSLFYIFPSSDFLADRNTQDIWDAWTFFKMVDDDGGGTVPMDEFLMGCLRLRGQARAVDAPWTEVFRSFGADLR